LTGMPPAWIEATPVAAYLALAQLNAPPSSPDASPIATAHDENLIAPASSGGDAVRKPR